MAKHNSARFKALGSFLKDRRESLGIAQKDISDALGYSSSQFISNWERGLCAPAFNALPALCKILGISKSEIIELILKETELELEAKFSHSVKSKLAGAKRA